MKELDLLRHSNDLRFEGVPMRQAYNAGKSGDWANYLEVFLGTGKQVQQMDKCESGRLVQKDGAGRRGPTEHSTGYSVEKHRLLEADHRASRRSESSLRRTYALIVRSLLDTGRSNAIGGVRLPAASTTGDIRS